MIDNLGLYDLRLAEKLNSIIVCVFIDGVKNNIAIVCHINWYYLVVESPICIFIITRITKERK